MLKKITVFCDASVSNQNKFAVGAFLVLDQDKFNSLSNLSKNVLKDNIFSQIGYLKINTHKSTLAELKTFLHVARALDPLENKDLSFYTDCQTLNDLYGKRRKKLILCDFKKKDGSSLAHESIYREIVDIFNSNMITIKKLKGHNSNDRKKTIDSQIFSIVDYCARKKLREIIDQ